MSMPSPLPEGGRMGEVDRVQSIYARRLEDDERYSWLSPAHLLMYQQVERLMLTSLRERGWTPVSGGRVLELGCGSGYWLREFVKFGLAPARLTGADLLRRRLEKGRRLSPAAVGFLCADGTAVPCRSGGFEIVLQSTMFSSILDDGIRSAVASEMRRLLAPGGVILSYDFCVRNPANPDVRPLSRGELANLFPDCSIRSRRVTLAPPLARWLAPRSWALCRLLEWFPFLRTFLWAEITPND